MPNGDRGAMQDEFEAYGRDGEPCSRCGTLIAKIRAAGRGNVVLPALPARQVLAPGSQHRGWFTPKAPLRSERGAARRSGASVTEPAVSAVVRPRALPSRWRSRRATGRQRACADRARSGRRRLFPDRLGLGGARRDLARGRARPALGNHPAERGSNSRFSAASRAWPCGPGSLRRGRSTPSTPCSKGERMLVYVDCGRRARARRPRD